MTEPRRQKKAGRAARYVPAVGIARSGCHHAHPERLPSGYHGRYIVTETTSPRHVSKSAAFLLLLTITVAYQFVYCYASTGGDPTGLFYSGDRMPRPAELNSGFQFHSSYGYDGQQYRVIAHDPLNRKGYWKYLDDERYRSRRILIPALAALFGGWSRQAVDLWFIAIVDISLALGGLCFVVLTEGMCPSLAAIAMYCAVPAVVASTDRMVLDGPLLAAFLAAWLFVRQGRDPALWVVLTCAPLIREAGLLITAGVALVFLSRRNFRGAMTALLTTAPALVWWGWAMLHTVPSSAQAALSIPLIPQFLRLFTVKVRPVSPLENVLFQATDFAAAACLILAFLILAARVWPLLRKRALDEDSLLIIPSGLLAAFASGAQVVQEPYSFARVDSILLVWAGIGLLQTRKRLAAYVYFPTCGLSLLIYRLLPLEQFVSMLSRAGRH